MAHIRETGIVPAHVRKTFKEAWQSSFSRKSMGNVVNHWRFVSVYAPFSCRHRIKWLLVCDVSRTLFLDTRLRVIAQTLHLLFVAPLQRTRSILRFIMNLDSEDLCRPHLLPPIIRLPVLAFFSPIMISERQCKKCGVDAEHLVSDLVLRKAGVPGWYHFNTLHWPASQKEACKRLCRRAANPLTKPWRYFQMRSGRKRGEF
jgi:hypothetical protein